MGYDCLILFVLGIPDFAKVYSFIGSVFDPDSNGHVQKLKEMDPINFETVSSLDVYVVICVRCQANNACNHYFPNVLVLECICQLLGQSTTSYIVDKCEMDFW